jgi:hypothetical protein
LVRAALSFAVVLALAAVFGAASASADTYCVSDSPPACVGTSEASIQDAINAAGSSPAPNQIEIGPGTLSGSQIGPSGEAQDLMGNPVTITGAGQTQTVLDGPSSGPALDIEDSGTTVSDLAIAMATGESSGLDLYNGTASRLTVTSTDPIDMGIAAINLFNAGRITDSTASVGGSFEDFAVYGEGVNGALVEDSTLTGATGFDATPGSEQATLQRDKVNAVSTGASDAGVDVDSGSLEVDDTLVVDASNPGGVPVGLSVTSSTSGTTTMTARNVTVIGPGSGTSYGAEAQTRSGGDATLSLHDAVIEGFGNALFTTDGGGSGLPPTITSDYSDYDASTDDSAFGGTIGPETNHLNVPPDFVSSMNFELAPGSPLIDAGTPGGLAPGESPTDLAGNPRLLAGNGGCTARRDIGAYEYSPTTIPVDASSGAPSAGVGASVTFSAIACSPDPSLTPSYSWSFDDGATASGPSVSHAFATPGTHRATVTVSDAAGRTGTAHVTVTVAEPPPVLTAVRQSRSRWREGSALPHASAHGRIPVGTTFTFALNEPAQVTLTFKRISPGRRVRHRCVARTRHNVHRPRCNRIAMRGTLSLASAEAGTNTIAFAGRINAATKLRPGSYSVTILAANAGGSSAPRLLRFTIVMR